MTTTTMMEDTTAEVAETLITIGHQTTSKATPFSIGTLPLHPQLTPTVTSRAIGVGIAHDTVNHAIQNAVRDALQRGMLGLGPNSKNNTIRVQLGVPIHLHKDVDWSVLKVILHTHSFETDLQVGGLLVEATTGTPVTMVVNACVIVTQSPTGMDTGATVLQNTTFPVTTPHPATRALEEIQQREQQQQKQQQEPQKEPVAHGFSTLPLITSLESVVMRNKQRPLFPVQPALIQGHSSMEMLAHVSEMIQDTEESRANSQNTHPGSSNAAYKKLPPGKTPKNYDRLFVKHNYRDHSHQVAQPEEQHLVGSYQRTPNAAFPLKLHEILTQVELDGLDHIIGWLPHGRSFKIHKHEEFVQTILPKYFVMTKKSSFLRQLNLYGFNRLSGAGSDQGSYYHELFLRGLKFLSRRMHRQKVNGNGIRAAGNPDAEPNLQTFPMCPPRSTSPSTDSSATLSEPETMQRPVVPQSTIQVVLGRRPSLKANSSGGNNSNHPTSFQAASFPLKLQRILDKRESEQKTDILSWLSHGRAFIVKDVDRFVKELMPLYFNQTKYSSFQRQCHMYHFQRITAGPDKGSYHHPHFQRGRPELSVHIQRTRINGKGTRRPGNPEAEPDFYSLPALPPIVPGLRVEIPVDLTAVTGDNSSVVSVGSPVGGACGNSTASEE